MGCQAVEGVRRRYLEIPGRTRAAIGAEAGCHHQSEPGDENNQDISSLVGKVDIRKLESLSQDDPDAYSYSGGLCLANQGLLEFVEMFKAPIKMLHPLLTATQEGNFKGTEGFSAIPFQGIILAHSNESEWQAFRNNRNNEAFLDRVYIVKVPYCLQVSEEVRIYRKLLRNSSLATAPCAPGTLDMMAFRSSFLLSIALHHRPTLPLHFASCTYTSATFCRYMQLHHHHHPIFRHTLLDERPTTQC